MSDRAPRRRLLRHGAVAVQVPVPFAVFRVEKMAIGIVVYEFIDSIKMGCYINVLTIPNVNI